VYSKVRILGHPVHPMLIGFPVAFYTATLVGFIIYAATQNIFWYTFAAVCNWVGVATALLAAVPGLIDWTLGVPRNTAAKSHGLKHMLLNVGALLVFAASGALAIARWGTIEPGAAWHIILSAVGMGLTLPAGFLGWSLVQKHHVGVDLTEEQELLEHDAHPAPPHRPLHTPVEHRPSG